MHLLCSILTCSRSSQFMRRQLETESPGDSACTQHWPLSFQECWRGDPVPPNISRKHLSRHSDLCALRLPKHQDCPPKKKPQENQNPLYQKRSMWLQNGHGLIPPINYVLSNQGHKTTRGPQQQCRLLPPFSVYKLHSVSDNTSTLPPFPLLDKIGTQGSR